MEQAHICIVINSPWRGKLGAYKVINYSRVIFKTFLKVECQQEGSKYEVVYLHNKM